MKSSLLLLYSFNLIIFLSNSLRYSLLFSNSSLFSILQRWFLISFNSLLEKLLCNSLSFFLITSILSLVLDKVCCGFVGFINLRCVFFFNFCCDLINSLCDFVCLLIFVVILWILLIHAVILLMLIVF